jgi:hypothetical protein
MYYVVAKSHEDVVTLRCSVTDDDQMNFSSQLVKLFDSREHAEENVYARSEPPLRLKYSELQQFLQLKSASDNKVDAVNVQLADLVEKLEEIDMTIEFIYANRLNTTSYPPEHLGELAQVQELGFWLKGQDNQWVALQVDGEDITIGSTTSYEIQHYINNWVQ